MRSVALLFLASSAAPVSAQSPASADNMAAFVTAVRASTERYRDRAAAIADGYRRIGPDFPSMGEHWVSIPLVVRGEVDARRPPILEYVTIAGRPTLAGVAYTQLVREGPPRAPLPAPASAWHYHAGSVDEESFILGHAEPASVRDSATGPRIAVLHAWLWLENPAGLFATDNWALPWYRLGMTPPTGTEEPTPAGLAAALATGGQGYYLALLRLRERLPAGAAARVAGLLDRHAAEWGALLQRVGERGLPVPIAELSAGWWALDGELREVCGTCSLSPHAAHP
jgi:hypothetical protein